MVELGPPHDGKLLFAHGFELGVGEKKHRFVRIYRPFAKRHGRAAVEAKRPSRQKSCVLIKEPFTLAEDVALQAAEKEGRSLMKHRHGLRSLRHRTALWPSRAFAKISQLPLGFLCMCTRQLGDRTARLPNVPAGRVHEG